MFEGITESLTSAFTAFRGTGKISEANIREGMKQVRTALLEADVAYDVAQDFVRRVTDEAVGERVLKSLRPDQQVVGIVHQALIDLMAGDHSLPINKDGLTIIMMCGLQGSGKTTTCGKLARMLKEQDLPPFLVAADLQRPAAIEQLKVIGQQVGCPVYAEDPAKSDPVQVCRNGVSAAKSSAAKSGGARVVILDTAGRLGIDEELMQELQRIDHRVGPDCCLFVCDAMTGQDAVNSAKAFNEALELDGVILTKLDGDTRGGAALSVRAVTGVPIKFVGVGEQLDRLEQFHPDRMAGRILGMGDVLSLVEKAQQEFDEQEMLAQQEKMQQGRFTLDDFRKQMRQIKKLGSMREIMKMIPGMGKVVDQMGDLNPEDDMRRIEGIIDSMTLDERENPDRIDRSRRMRIAKGSGVDPAEVSKLLKDFQSMGRMMQDMSNMGLRDRMKAVKQMADGGLMNPGADLREKKMRSKRGPADVDALRDKKKKQRKDAKKAKKRNRRR
ncbi:MAG: signal recognition particle protein [Planctomycetaceae bacterium]|nr:signal recognition particle protein [Planctomycetaceae bacterium]